MVGLVVETPLANGKVGTGVLDLLDHLDELVLFVVLQLLELLNAGDVELVLRLGLWGLECARQDGDLGVSHLRRHLGVGEVLVDNDTLDEEGILKRASNLAVNLDQLEIDIFSLEVGNGEDSVDGDVGKLFVGLGNDLASQTCSCYLDQIGSFFSGKLDLVGDLIKLSNRDIAGLVVTVGDSDRVDALVDEVGGLLEQSTSKDNDASSTVTDLVVLRFGELD